MTRRDAVNAMLVAGSVIAGYGCEDKVAVVLMILFQLTCYSFVRTCVYFPGEKP